MELEGSRVMYERINSYYISIQEASRFSNINELVVCVYGDQKQFIAILRAAGRRAHFQFFLSLR